MINKNTPILCDDITCTGCGVCENICPVDAIKLTPNFEGFATPLINPDICIGCLKCEKSCPIINSHKSQNEKDPIVFAGWNKDKDIRKESSSGGIFSALADFIISKGGVVCGAAYDNNMNVNHIIIDSINDIPKLRGSKYVQSNINKILREIKQLLEDDRLILFVGTPCQVVGLKSYLGKEYNNLYCCDFICHGVPSQLLFKKYINWLEKKYNQKIINFNFRGKQKGWYDASRVYNNKTLIKGDNDSYFLWFNKNISLRECCYKCPANGLPRNGDLTIADFWRIGMRNKFNNFKEINNGVSLTIVNNLKGDYLLKMISNKIDLENRNLEEAIYGNKPMIIASNRPQKRDNFYIDLQNKQFEQIIEKYSKLSIKQRILITFKENFPKFAVTTFRNIIHTINYMKNGN